MMGDLSQEIQTRLQTEQNIWLATVRPNNRPHLVPLWFVWHNQKIYLCTGARSIKGRNIQANPYVSLALEDGVKAVICEGVAVTLPPPWPETIVQLFQQKYDWAISPNNQAYNVLIDVKPSKWLLW